MSRQFQGVMRDISRILKVVYHAQAAVIVPGSGTFGMEAVARQFATGRRCLVIRNGWFSYRWSQIFEMGGIPSATHVLKARPTGTGSQAAFAPAPIAEVCAAIAEFKPDVVFAPHVETSAGILLPDAYVGAAARAVGALFVLDCIASGTVWVDMERCAVDVLISAPQKGWSGPPCCALVALGARARSRIDATASTSFSCDLKKWLQIMETYEKGGHAYHATLPTDALVAVRDVMLETERYGFDAVCLEQQVLGRQVRELLASRGFKSVAAPGFEAPGVVVSFTTDPQLQSGGKFLAEGLQIAAGVPLQCDEGPEFRSFRIGLFGLDKLHNPGRTVDTLDAALQRLL
jgi:aspartate aminotransferase-like enzyme